MQGTLQSGLDIKVVQMPFFFVLFCLCKSCGSPSLNTPPVNNNSSLDTTSKLCVTRRCLSYSFLFFSFFLLELEMLRQTKSCRFWRKKAGHSSCDIWNKLVKLKSHQKNSTERFSSLKLQRTHFCSVWLFIKNMSHPNDTL